MQVISHCYKQTFDGRTLLTTLHYRSANPDYRGRWTRIFEDTASQSQKSLLVENCQFYLLHPVEGAYWNFTEIFGVSDIN